MEDFANPSIREITIKCSAQSAKTLTIMVLLCWVIAEDPGPTLWLTFSEKEAKKLMKTRLREQLQKCEKVAEKIPKSKSGNTQLEIYFPGAPLVIAGAEQKSALQSTPYRYLFLDEVRSYPKGALEMVSKRVRSYPHNYKKVIISTPDLENDALDMSYMLGDQNHPFCKCRNSDCQHEMLIDWMEPDDAGGLKWDTNTITRPDGAYDYTELEKTIRFKCEKCGSEYFDVPADRKYISRNAYWKPQNEKAAKDVRSYWWCALLPWWTSWSMQVREFLEAKKAMKLGDLAKLKDHWNETRGKSWSDRIFYNSDQKLLKPRMFPYIVTDPFPEERRRFLSVDVQSKGGFHLWALGRAWAAGARSRWLFFRKVWSWEEMIQLQQEFSISDDNVIIDSAHKTAEVYQQVLRSGVRWKAFRGDDKRDFINDGQRMIFQKSMVDPAIGTENQGRVPLIPLYLWSKPSAINRLGMFMSGQMGDWQLPKFQPGIEQGTSIEYQLQVTAWDERQRIESRTNSMITERYNRRPDNDHASDCEQMQVVAATITGLLGT